MDFVRLFSLANGPWMALRFPNGSFGVLGTINHPSQGENSLVGCCLHTKKGDLLFVSCGGGSRSCYCLRVRVTPWPHYF